MGSGSNLVVTCMAVADEPLMLFGVRSEHGRQFAVYGEADHDAVGFVVQALNLDSGDKLETEVLPATSTTGASWVLLSLELVPGRWQLSLETVVLGVIARRIITVHDGEQEV